MSIGLKSKRFDNAARFLVGQTTSIQIQYIRSFIAGGVATLVDMTFLFVLTEFVRIHYQVSAAFGFVSGLIILYLLNVLWIFPERKYQSRKVEFIIFSLIGLIGIVFNGIIIYIGVEIMHQWYIIAKIISAFAVFTLNFILRKILLFS